MPSFSVKKPITIFVAVVIVIVLGIVSYTNMTPSLLPSMDLPYVMVSTTYIGASPEKVETTVTKPMEESMATLENIKSVTSVSSENYSLLVLEFAEGANLDAATLDILQKTERLKAGWDDMVGTPSILKLNPDMLPVLTAAVDRDGMGIAEFSAFVEDELLNKLEGITGVASVSATGLLDEQVDVVLNQEKIDALNAKIIGSIDNQFAETEDELREGKEELEKQKNQIESGKGDMDSGKNQLSEGTAEAESALNQKQNELLETKIQLQVQLNDLKKQLAELEKTEKTLTELQASMTQLDAMEQGLGYIVGLLNSNPGLSVDMILESLPPSYAELAEMLAGKSNAEVEAAYQEVKDAKNQIDTALTAMGIKAEDIPATLAELSTGMAQLKAGIATMESTIAQLEEGSVQLSDALKELNKQKTAGILDLSGITSQMVVGESTIAQMLQQVESGLEQVEAAKDAAYQGADLNNIITMDMVSNILTAQNFSMPAGYVEQDGVRYLVSVGNEFEEVAELEDLMLFDLGMDDIEPIYLSDVADIAKSDNSNEIYAKVNGNNGVILSFNKQSNGATADVSDKINAKFKALEEEYEGLHFTSLMDQGDYIYLIVKTIMQNLILGAVFSVIVLFLFLRDIRPTLITLISIPVSVLFAMTLMYFSGVTLNMLSLSGLAVAVGMLVDNSVVVIENVYRLRYKGYSAVKSAVSGAAQVAGAVMASTLTTICVFLPIVFVEGLTRQLFVDFALTFGYALLASLIVALTLVPAMSSNMLKKEPKVQRELIMGRLNRVYGKSVGWALKHKAIVLIAASVLLVLSSALAMARGFSFMPEMGGDTISVSLTMPEDSTLDETKEVSDEAIARIREIDGVETVGAMISGSGGMMSMGSSSSNENSVTIYILPSENNKRDLKEISEEIITKCEDLNAEITASDSAMMDMGALSGNGISVNLFGTDLDKLQETAKGVASVLDGIEGTGEVSDGLEDAEPGIRFVVDKEKAMKEGLTVAQIMQELGSVLTYDKSAITLTEDSSRYDVIVKKGESGEYSLNDIKAYKFKVTDRDGEERLVPIRDIAEIVETESLDSIRRMDQRRYMTVTAEIQEGYNVSLVANEIERQFKDYDLPDGISMEYAGENETIVEAMVELIKMLLLGILLVYLVMAAQFQSLKSPFIIMFTIPLAFTGGMLALLVTGYEVSVISLIGFVMLVGIIVNNGIVLVDYINQLRQDGADKRKAIIEAGVTRMRPILMTTITTILGLCVTAFSSGTGAEMMKPIAFVCIGGLTYATILTMYVVPCLYDILNRKKFVKIDAQDLVIAED